MTPAQAPGTDALVRRAEQFLQSRGSLDRNGQSIVRDLLTRVQALEAENHALSESNERLQKANDLLDGQLAVPDPDATLAMHLSRELNPECGCGVCAVFRECLTESFMDGDKATALMARAEAAEARWQATDNALRLVATDKEEFRQRIVTLEAELSRLRGSNAERIAELIAREAHSGQREKYGRKRPYIEHVESVVALVSSPDEKAVAWLHDVIEDTEWMPADFDRYGVPLHITDAVLLLSRNKALPYEDYIEAIIASGNPLVQTVKVADLREHLHDTCPDHLRPRYEAALKRLTCGLEAEGKG